MRIFSALSISAGALFMYQTLEYHDHLLLMATLLTFYLAMALLLITLAKVTTRSPNPTYAQWIHHLGTATLGASFTTLALSVLPEAYTAFTNSIFFSPQTVSLASESGLILITITLAYKSINLVPISWLSQQSTKVGLFTLSVAVAGAYTESEDFTINSFIPYSSIIYRTYCIYRFGLMPCAFVLGVVLLIIGIADVPDTDSSAARHFVPVTCKEGFARLTLSVGFISLLVGAFLAVVSLLTIDPAVLGGGAIY